MQTYLIIVLAPLLAAILAGLAGKVIGRAGAHTVTILGVATSCVLSIGVLKGFIDGTSAVFNGAVYTWLVTDGIRMEVGFLVHQLTAMMMVVVTVCAPARPMTLPAKPARMAASSGARTMMR